MNTLNYALDLREKGFNCSQAVFASTSQSMGIDLKAALRIASCFGGGLRMGETCGALTGALMTLGLHTGHDCENNIEEKQRINQLTVDFINQFKERAGAARCTDLLEGLNSSIPEDRVIIEERNLFKLICPQAIEVAIKLLEEHLLESE